MNAVEKFRKYCDDGVIGDFYPIPNKLFTLNELYELFDAGMIIENNNTFLAIVD